MLGVEIVVSWLDFKNRGSWNFWLEGSVIERFKEINEFSFYLVIVLFG